MVLISRRNRRGKKQQVPGGAGQKQSTDTDNYEVWKNGLSSAQYQQIAQVIGRDWVRQDFTYNHRAQNVSKEELLKYLKNPDMYFAKLLELSAWLYDASGHYRRLIQYFANMATLNWVVNVQNTADFDDGQTGYAGIDKGSFRRKYFRVTKMLSKMNLRHELHKIMEFVFREGIYFGYAVEDRDSFFFCRLNPFNCRISAVQDGCFLIDYDLSSAMPENLNALPADIAEAVLDRRSGGTESRWLRLDGSRAICIKADETTAGICPPFIHLLSDIIDLNDFKDLQKQAAENDNVMIFTLEVPVDQSAKEVDRIQLSSNIVKDFTGVAQDALPGHIAVVPTPMKPGFLTAKSSSTDKDNVKSATNSMYRNAGAQLLNNDTSVGLKYSLESDAAIVYGLLRQIERWVNRRIKLLRYNGPAYKFQFQILDQTVYNAQVVADKYRGAAERSVPVLVELAASVGLTPDNIEGKHFLQNILFDLPGKWQPPKTAFTQTKSDDVGATEKKLEDLSEEGLATVEQGSDMPDARDY